jgi:hypothetical protein
MSLSRVQDHVQLYEIICQLDRLGMSLPPIGDPLRSLPTERYWEMLRLPLLHGMTLREAGSEIGTGHERARQLSPLRFGLLDIQRGPNADRIGASTSWRTGV